MHVRANGSTDGFLKSAALLTGIVTGIITLVFIVILPLYSSSSPIESKVQSTEQQLDQQQDATITLLRQALIASCERANVIRRNQRIVLQHHPQLRGTGAIPDVNCVEAVP